MSRFLRHLLPVLLLVFLQAVAPFHATAFIPQTGVEVSAQVADTALPSMTAFIQQVRTGAASQVTGVYVAEVFAFPVVQQPSGQPAFVSQMDNTLTQFGMASSYGSLGFLAHNTLAGESFTDIELYQQITVVYGDGHYITYQVMDIRSFQATAPSSPYSSFIDLETHKTLSASDLFLETYGTKNSLVLQTCITASGIDNWGRLFVLAVPFFPEPATHR